MDATTAGLVLTGLSSLLLALGQVLERTRFSRAGARELRASNKRLSRQMQVALSYIHRLESRLAGAGGRVPTRPKELDPDWGFKIDEEDELAEKRKQTEHG
jgi:hypothetical protein